MSAVAPARPLTAAPSSSSRRPAANMLMPQAYDVAWTELEEIFDGEVSPGSLGTGGAAARAAAAVAAKAARGYSSAPPAVGMALAANPRRACLMLQNNSATGGPVLWFAFGLQAVAGASGSFALQPGSSLVIAEADACPKEAVYIAWNGTGAQVSAVYENSLPAGQGQLVSSDWQSNIGAIAWGYASSELPPPPASPAPSLRTLWTPPPS